MIRVYSVKIALCILLAVASLSERGWAQYTSNPIDAANLAAEPYRYAGISMSDYTPCSGAVVADTRLLLSAAHCVFNEDAAANESPWLPTPEWFLRYHASTLPTIGSGKQTRGYWVFTNYAESVRNYSMRSPKTFDLDLIAAYAFEGLADSASGYWKDGYQAFVNNTWKETVGYPSSNYPSQHTNKYLMHHNGPWTASCQTVQNSYVLCSEVSSGPGNSGGPVFVLNPEDSKYYYAGVLVSGLRRLNGDPGDWSGINLMSTDEWSLVNAAKEAAIKGGSDGSGSMNNPTPTPLPSGGQRLGVYGNSQYIPSGKSHTSRGDMTEFGSITGRRTLTRTFLLYNYGSSVLNFSADSPVVFYGRGRRYFRRASRLPSSLAAQQTHPLRISFRSSPRGVHTATVYIQSDDPQRAMYSFTIRARRR